MDIEYGRYEDRLPYVRVGSGDEKLVVLPGLNDSMWNGKPNRAMAELFARRYLTPYADDREVWLVSRPRGLSEDATTQTMAGGVATLVDELGTASVFGLSMGGLVAQHLAADYPELVDKLVLGSSGARLGNEGRVIVERWQGLAEAEEWGKLARDLSDVAYQSPRKYVSSGLGTLAATVGLGKPAVPADVAISCRASLEHDTTERLPSIHHEALVIGGSGDRLFPETVLRETARGLVDARLAVVPDAGHAALEERKKSFEATVSKFLDG